MENKNKIRKKAAILSVADLRHMTCANFFCEYFKRNKIDFDFICIQRYEKQQKLYMIVKCININPFYRQI